MSKTRKILSVVLALAMIVSTFAITAFAGTASYEDADNEYNQTWALSEPVDNGDDTYTVDVSLTTDYATGVIQFVLTNTDAAAVQYDSIAIGEAIPDGSDAENDEPDYSAEISAYEVVDEDTNTSTVKVMITPTTYEVSTIEAVAIDGVIAKVTYKLVDGSADITLKDDASSSTNPAGSLIAARVSDGNIVTGDMITGQNVAIDVATVTIKGEEEVLPSDLVKKATAEAGIIIDKGHTFGGAYDGVVYGFTQKAVGTFATLAYLQAAFEATNGGSLSYSRSIGTSGYGTGTVITVTGLDGGVKNYVVVIFADVDGNGLTNINDTKAVKKAVSVASTYANNSVQRMAANCHNTTAAALQHLLNLNDTKAVKAHVGGTKVDQALYASRMAANTQYYR